MTPPFTRRAFTGTAGPAATALTLPCAPARPGPATAGSGASRCQARSSSTAWTM
jgi:hypothetical protein